MYSERYYDQVIVDNGEPFLPDGMIETDPQVSSFGPVSEHVSRYRCVVREEFLDTIDIFPGFEVQIAEC